MNFVRNFQEKKTPLNWTGKKKYVVGLVQTEIFLRNSAHTKKKIRLEVHLIINGIFMFNQV